MGMMRVALLPLLVAATGCSGESVPQNAAVPVENGVTTDNTLAGNPAAAEPSPSPSPSPIAPAAEPDVLLNLTGGALSFVDPNSGRARELAFGTERAMIERAVEAALGKPVERGSNGECEEGAMDFARMPGGLLVWFQQGKFVGWFLDSREGAKLTTAAGIGIGSTRKELTGAYDADFVESTLGEEFIAGDLSGLLSGREATDKVTAIWSGQVCNFR